MHCQLCHVTEATVFLMEIIDDQEKTFHLCENCAQQNHLKEMLGRSAKTIQELFNTTVISETLKPLEKNLIDCPQCGLSWESFKLLGRLGCSKCYSTFGKILMLLIRKYHQSDEYDPQSLIKDEKKAISVIDLRKELQIAISDEAFEKAALLRDQLKTFEEHR